MTTIGIIGAGEVGSHIARAAIASGYSVVLANSRGPDTLSDLVEQAPRILTWGMPPGAPDRVALAVSSNFPEAVEIVTRLYDQFGFDTLDHSPLSGSWRNRPGQPAWKQERQTRAELAANLANARKLTT